MLLAIELALLCQMCDPHFKFEEDRTKMRSLSRAIGTRSDRRTLQVILYLSNAMKLHWTDKNHLTRNSVSGMMKHWNALLPPFLSMDENNDEEMHCKQCC